VCSARQSDAAAVRDTKGWAGKDDQVTGDTGGLGADLSGMRRSYGDQPLGETDVAGDWLAQFRSWFDDAVAAGLPEPNAMIVATANPQARPSARTVLLKSLDERGFVFFTNYTSRKGAELTANPYASLVFPWFAMKRQVVVVGDVERVDRAETEAYFATRPRESQLGAWASPQSQPVPDRRALDELYDATSARFIGDVAIPAPPHWGGLRVRPQSVEFWQGRTGRLHDRLRFAASGSADGTWVVERLAP
jgi:pyridoxamine 5'-phosphate oxidase